MLKKKERSIVCYFYWIARGRNNTRQLLHFVFHYNLLPAISLMECGRILIVCYALL